MWRAGLGYLIGAVALFIDVLYAALAWSLVKCCTFCRRDGRHYPSPRLKLGRKFKLWLLLLVCWLTVMFGFDLAQSVVDVYPTAFARFA